NRLFCIFFFNVRFIVVYVLICCILTLVFTPGQTCSCPAPLLHTDLDDVILEWTRSDLEDTNVFLFRDGRPYLSYQHEQFRGHVELPDPSLQSGDLSIILKDVALQDSGKYRCHVKSLLHVRKRSVFNTPPIKVIDLKVLGPGESHLSDE
uniref:Ig-like domain-containing protein n=1 Tax=Periophthalmus magnuspinnatus TaxID=409849 RepID=A0A3B4BFN6_9GOBI